MGAPEEAKTNRFTSLFTLRAFKHIEGTDDICFHVSPRIFHRRGDTGIGSKMNDNIHSGSG
jgi:hypothetical protein